MTKFVSLPLYDSYDYEYPVSLQDNSFVVRLYFNERMWQWFFDVTDDTGDKLISGRRLTLEGTAWIAEIQELEGCLYLEPLGLDINETLANYDKLYKYYKMFYLYNE